MSLRLLVVAEHLRRNQADGITTYTRGLLGGLAAMNGGGPDVTLWPDGPAADRLPGPAWVQAWDRGLLGPPASGAVDVVHAPSLAAPPVRRRGGAPMTVTVHDLAWRRVPEAFPTRGVRWHEAALGRAAARAAVLIAPSQQTADDLVGGGVPARRVEVVEEGCDHLAPPDEAGAADLLARLGVGPTFLLTVSTIEPRKNLPRLVEAYQQARPRLPEPWPLVVVGASGWGPDLAPSPGVVLAGPVGGGVLSALYGAARLVAYVPLFEGYGLPAVEAMAAGVPVVASPMPSTGGAACEVDPSDVVSMAGALAVAATDEGVRADLVAAGRRRAAGLTWKAAAAGHVEIWASLG